MFGTNAPLLDCIGVVGVWVRIKLALSFDEC